MIKIETVLNILKEDHNFREILQDGEYHYSASGVSFNQISYDSRKVNSETLFFVKGANFKKEFLEQAIEQDLQWYVAEQDFEVSIPAIIVTDIKQAMSLIAMEFYDHPERQLKLLAFTGTKGKTTSAYYAYKILEQGHRPAMLSTMNTTLDGKTFFKSTLTTPESIDLFEMMAQAVANDRTHLALGLFILAMLQTIILGLYTVLSPMIQALFQNRKAILYFGYGVLVKLILQVPFIYVFKAYGPLLSTTIGLMIPIVLMYKEIHQVTHFNRKTVFKRSLLTAILTLIMLLVVLVAGFILGLVIKPNGRVTSMIYVSLIGGVGIVVYGGLGLRLRFLDRFIGSKAASLRNKFHIS